MNLFLFFLALTIVLAAGIFLWPARRNRKAKPNVLPRPLFKEELAAELGPQIRVSMTRPASGPPEIQLPQKYGVDRMVLLARDPHWLFAYWEVTATKQEEFKSSYGPETWPSTHPVLRVYDVTDVDFNGNNANSYIDLHIEEHVDNWHIEVGEPDRTFCVDLGRMFPDGRFVTLLRSNVVTTPRASLSDRLDEEWMWIEGLYRSIEKIKYGTSSPLIIEELAIRKGALPLGISSPGKWDAGSKN
ncbi:MAG: DUF4912 domain-containing protein [Desulfotomaculaceae bacterium]|nr:DUF4912 domain-containing protein [Desulfotomaculaceae bacterium]